jgi:hypothetical protein
MNPAKQAGIPYPGNQPPVRLRLMAVSARILPEVDAIEPKTT